MQINLGADKVIAKNTIFLYIRMLFVMIVSLYTVRIILKTLGEEDYGIYNAVGGVVSMITFVTSTMSSASLRFFAFELGRNNLQRVNQYFNVSLRSFLLIAIIIVIVAETIGVWFLKTKMTIPYDRLSAAFWVYQCSLLSFVLSVITIPYSALIIARERMNIFAYVGIADVLIKLSIVFLLQLFFVDKLKLYAVLMLVAHLLYAIFYVSYSRYYFAESKITYYRNKLMSYEVLSYSGWNLLGALASVGRSQGINILLNVFFNPIINAARAIAYQVEGAVTLFVTNFYTAVRPQITKRYAVSDNQGMMSLVFSSSRLCYFLSLILILPLIIETPTILNMWLEEVPEHTISFTRIILLLPLVESLGYPFHASIASTGDIKNYQIVVSSLTLLTLPLTYVLFKIGFNSEFAMIMSIVTASFSQVARLYYMRKQLMMSIRAYCKDVIFKILLSSIIATICSLLLSNLILISSDFYRLVIVCLSSIISSGIIIFFVGISSHERNLAVRLFIRYIHR